MGELRNSTITKIKTNIRLRLNISHALIGARRITALTFTQLKSQIKYNHSREMRTEIALGVYELGGRISTIEIRKI